MATASATQKSSMTMPTVVMEMPSRARTPAVLTIKQPTTRRWDYDGAHKGGGTRQGVGESRHGWASQRGVVVRVDVGGRGLISS